jgi:hypothetical protein
MDGFIKPSQGSLLETILLEIHLLPDRFFDQLY